MTSVCAQRAGANATLLSLLEQSLAQHRSQRACVCMGRSLSYGQIDDLSQALAAYLQGLGLARGERVAVMLPNVPQYLVTVAAVLRAGLVVVNVSPQLSAEDLEHQLRDSGAGAIVLIDSAAGTLAQVADKLPLRSTIVATLGDLLGPLKGRIVNHWMHRVTAGRSRSALPDSLGFNQAVQRGRRMILAPAAVGPEDIAVLQYTGGTTGTARGVVLLHRNLVANLQQSLDWYGPALDRVPARQQVVMVGALPLHHIFAFTLVMLLGLRIGACALLVPRPQDIASLIKQLSRQRFHCFPGIDPLFRALALHVDAHRVDWSSLQLTLGGALAVGADTAELWQQLTGSTICQGYGLTEAAPAVTCNPVTDTHFSGHVGLPLGHTELALLDDEGRRVPVGQPGEIAIRGPQLMAGYWQRPDETARAITADGFVRSGDIGVIDAKGHLRLLDRKKDLIFVSGFNVYPSEVEDIVVQMPGIRSCAAVAMPDALAGEAVKLVLVRADDAATCPSEADVRAWCAQRLISHKQPRQVEFRRELPLSAVGKVLRRGLRESV